MPSLIGADAGSGVNVAANYLKTSPSTQFGTRALKFLAINVDTASGDSDVDHVLSRARGSGVLRPEPAESGSLPSVWPRVRGPHASAVRGPHRADAVSFRPAFAPAYSLHRGRATLLGTGECETG